MDFNAAISKPINGQKFASAFVEAYLSPAFGARSKSEIDILVFTLIDRWKIPGCRVFDQNLAVVVEKGIRGDEHTLDGFLLEKVKGLRDIPNSSHFHFDKVHFQLFFGSFLFHFSKVLADVIAPFLDEHANLVAFFDLHMSELNQSV